MLVSTLPLGAQVGLGLSPMRVDFAATAGKPHSGGLSLSNATSVKMRVRAELLDLYIDETTTPQFVASAPAEAEYSCRTWLSVNPMELEIDPGKQVTVRYTVRVPATVSERGYHCALGFRTLPTVSEEGGTAMRTAVRMIAAVYPTVGNPAIVGVIKDLKLEPVPGSGLGWRAVVIMENSGLQLYRPIGALEILDSSGKVIESQQLASFPTLPGRQQRYVLGLDSKLAPGPYVLKARVEVGGEIQEAEVAVTAAAPAQAVVAAEKAK
jgi:hypothetical protein